MDFALPEIIDWIQDDADRRNHVLGQLLPDEPTVAEVREIDAIVAMPSLERDAFLAELCRECALLGVEWPADPKAVTHRIPSQGAPK